MKPYTVNAAPVVAQRLAGMDAWLTRAVYHSNKSLWNNGSFIVREIRGKPGIISNHAKGVAVDLSYRWIKTKNKGRQDGRKVSLTFINTCLKNADTLGIELVIDYARNRSWRCDRGRFCLEYWLCWLWNLGHTKPDYRNRECDNEFDEWHSASTFSVVNYLSKFCA